MKVIKVVSVLVALVSIDLVCLKGGDHRPVVLHNHMTYKNRKKLGFFSDTFL